MPENAEALVEGVLKTSDMHLDPKYDGMSACMRYFGRPQSRVEGIMYGNAHDGGH